MASAIKLFEVQYLYTGCAADLRDILLSSKSFPLGANVKGAENIDKFPFGWRS